MEVGLLSHVVSKENGLVREWSVRRKVGFIFVDIIVSKGQVPVDFRKRGLMAAIDEMIKAGHQITEIKCETGHCGGSMQNVPHDSKDASCGRSRANHHLR